MFILSHTCIPMRSLAIGNQLQDNLVIGTEYSKALCLILIYTSYWVCTVESMASTCIRQCYAESLRGSAAQLYRDYDQHTCRSRLWPGQTPIDLMNRGPIALMDQEIQWAYCFLLPNCIYHVFLLDTVYSARFRPCEPESTYPPIPAWQTALYIAIEYLV